jgi:hypothetical protein
MTFIGQHLPELVPFMEDTYTPQAVNQARNSFKKKVRKASATFFYGAMCGFFTTDELDDLLFEASEVARFLLEVEGTTLDIDEEIDIEDRITKVMRSVGETAKTILQTRVMDAQQQAPDTVSSHDDGEKRKIPDTRLRIKSKRNKKQKNEMWQTTSGPEIIEEAGENPIEPESPPASTLNSHTPEILPEKPEKKIVVNDDMDKSGSGDEKVSRPDAGTGGTDPEADQI